MVRWKYRAKLYLNRVGVTTNFRGAVAAALRSTKLSLRDEDIVLYDMIIFRRSHQQLDNTILEGLSC